MTRALRFDVSKRAGTVSALLELPDDARVVFVLAHGAGAPMTHPFMSEIADRLAERRIGTFRFQFPYMEAKKRRPDFPALLHTTVRRAVETAEELAKPLPLIAGGKSMGGRMTSGAMAQEPIASVRGLVFLGFPLHPAGRPGTERGDHLEAVQAPMLFLQGARDVLAGLDLLSPVCEALGSRATLHVVDGADHSFRVLKRSGRTQDQVMDELANATASWVETAGIG